MFSHLVYTSGPQLGRLCHSRGTLDDIRGHPWLSHWGCSRHLSGWGPGRLLSPHSALHSPTQENEPAANMDNAVKNPVLETPTGVSQQYPVGTPHTMLFTKGGSPGPRGPCSTSAMPEGEDDAQVGIFQSSLFYLLIPYPDLCSLTQVMRDRYSRPSPQAPQECHWGLLGKGRLAGQVSGQRDDLWEGPGDFRKASVAGHREVGKTSWPNLTCRIQWSMDGVDQRSANQSVEQPNS